MLNQLWLIGFVALPLIFAPLRYEGYETPRAMLSILLNIGILMAAFAMRSLPSPAEVEERSGSEIGRIFLPLSIVWRGGRGVRSVPGLNWFTLLRDPLLLAILAWVLCIIISALLSLSPSRSIFGDLQRRMGALTQLSLIAAFIGGALVSRRTLARCWPLLAITAVIIAVYAMLQRLGLSPFVPGWIIRPSGTIGTAPFAGTWAVTALLWLVVAVIAGSPRYRWLYLAGSVALLLLLTLTQARGALLGLGAGGVTLTAIWLIFRGKQRLAALIVLGATITFALGIGIYSGVVQIDLLSGRLRASEDRTGQFRLELWRTTAQLFREWPTMIDSGGHGDKFSTLRPVIGYGQEMVEVVERLYIDDDLRATYPATEFIDRAHNLWLDTLATQGIAGLLALIGVYAAGLLTCIRVLHSRDHSLPRVSPPDTLNASSVNPGGSPRTPPLYEMERGAGGEVPSPRWIAAAALAILVAHVVDLQFSFPSVAGEWPFWATLGLLFGTSVRPFAPRRWPEALLDRKATALLPLFAWIITWGLASVLPNTPDRLLRSALCVVILSCCLALWACQIERRTFFSVIIASALAASIQYIMTALIAATPQPDRLATLLLVDHALFLIILIALIPGIHRFFAPIRLKGERIFLPLSTEWRGGRGVRFSILIFAGAFILLDSTADSLLAMAGRVPQPAHPAIYAAAVTFKTHDDRLLHLSAQGVTDLMFAVPITPSQVAQAQSWLERAAMRNPYDANITIQRARLAIMLALSTQRTTYLDTADGWFALAVRQWPNNPAFWIERAQFVLHLRQEPARAITFAIQAQHLTRTAPGSDRLIGDAYRALALTAEAERAYRRALTVDPKDSAAALALAQVLSERGDLLGAKNILMRALQRSTITLKRIQVLTALVRVIEDQGDPGLALRYVESALSVASNPVDRARLLEARARLREKTRTR